LYIVPSQHMPQPTQMLVTNSPGREYPPKAQRQGNR